MDVKEDAKTIVDGIVSKIGEGGISSSYLAYRPYIEKKVKRSKSNGKSCSNDDTASKKVLGKKLVVLHTDRKLAVDPDTIGEIVFAYYDQGTPKKEIHKKDEFDNWCKTIVDIC